jgi:hypothetical protein
MSEESHSLVSTHPITRHRIFSPLSDGCEIVGLPTKHGADLLDELRTHTHQPEFCYQHYHDAEEIIISDARTTDHPFVCDQCPYDRPMGGSCSRENSPVSPTRRPGDLFHCYHVLLRPTAPGSFSALMRSRR